MSTWWVSGEPVPVRIATPPFESVRHTRSPAAAPVMVTFADSPPLMKPLGALTWTVATAFGSQVRPSAACVVARRHWSLVASVMPWLWPSAFASALRATAPTSVPSGPVWPAGTWKPRTYAAARLAAATWHRPPSAAAARPVLLVLGSTVGPPPPKDPSVPWVDSSQVAALARAAATSGFAS